MAGDLNLKKSWNPQLVKNQQKVWQQEQEKLDEFKKIKELNQEFKSEQEYIDLLKLQYGDNFKLEELNKSQKLKLSKLNWMYDDVPFENQQEEEETKNESGFIESNLEFNEGKEKIETMLNASQSFAKTKVKDSQSDRINKIIGMGNGVKAKNVNHSLDDPLMKIKLQQKQVQRSTLKRKHEDGDSDSRELKHRKKHNESSHSRDRSTHGSSHKEDRKERHEGEHSDRHRRHRSSRDTSSDGRRSHRSSHSKPHGSTSKSHRDKEREQPLMHSSSMHRHGQTSRERTGNDRKQNPQY
ncbi:CWC25 [[Candida] subhashii]|uniref:Pre-mRNA-splicing factor CWC25 n=1 Tax=[Candida] subhashii TaxID=561895 RepID=A0A8J5UYG4_9ASCO|nr:CWC25 [[Candida] subhashii]KAG7664295.1 CWC25 [[Candida] subhashii]